MSELPNLCTNYGEVRMKKMLAFEINVSIFFRVEWDYFWTKL